MLIWVRWFTALLFIVLGFTLLWQTHNPHQALEEVAGIFFILWGNNIARPQSEDCIEFKRRSQKK